MNVMYVGDLLDERTTPGVYRALAPTMAFERLLAGTSLQVIESGAR